MSSTLPFAEKYKPKNTSQLILNEILKLKIKQIVETKNIPNLILSGKSGIGKTAIIHAIAMELYPRQNAGQILEINASDDRGIKIVNENIVNFCNTCTQFKEGFAQHKLVILDEADNLTSKAQKLISSTMDEFPNVKFVFTCNVINQIIISINSRCLPLEISNLPMNDVINRLKQICEIENINYSEGSLEYLFSFNNNNFRQTLNILEYVYQTDRTIITIDKINTVCGIPSEEQFNNILNLINTKNIKGICMECSSLQSNGYYANDTLIYFIQHLKYKEFENKMKILEHLSDSAYSMSSNTSNYLQLTSAFLNLIELI